MLNYIRKLFKRDKPATSSAISDQSGAYALGKFYPGVPQPWADAVVKMHKDGTDQRFMDNGGVP